MNRFTIPVVFGALVVTAVGATVAACLIAEINKPLVAPSLSAAEIEAY